MTWYRARGKRWFDLVSSTLGLLLLGPFLAVVALGVRLDSSGPVLLRQRRVGLDGKAFDLLKFRTMTDRPRSLGAEVLPSHPDVTRLGRILRRFKIDELPQLANVLRGEMSLVGPRPAMPEQVAEYNDLAKRRLRVRPGLTGLAQVRGNIHLPWPERWHHDAEYVATVNFMGDLKILYRTLAVVLLGEERGGDRPR